MTRQHLFGCLSLLTALLIFSLCAGCETDVAGGQSRHETGSLKLIGGQSKSHTGATRVYIDADGRLSVEQTASNAATTQSSYDSTHDNVATTQPSIRTNANVMPNVGHADEGELGSITFKQLQDTTKKYPEYWLAGILLVVAGFVGYFMHRPIDAAVIAALAVAVALMPAVVGIIALVVVIGYVFVRYGSAIKQLVQSHQNVFDSVPVEQKPVLKIQAEAAQDGWVKKLVAVVKSAL
jgi:hypothetical protein